jgi:hypothetical protein
MSHSSGCSFCSKLPCVSSPGLGSPSRCPLCKAPLIRARGSGASYRLDVLGEPRRGWKRAVGVAAIVVLTTGGIVVVALSRGLESPPAAEVAVVATPSPSVDWTALHQAARRVETAAPAPRVSPPAGQPPVAPKPLSKLTCPKPAPAPLKVEQARAKPAPAPPAMGAAAHKWWSDAVKEEDYRHFLQGVPEVDLDKAASRPASPKEGLTRLQELAALHTKAGTGPDAFVAYLERERSDLAGLPFRKGKECTLKDTEALQLARLSREMRLALARSLSVSPSSAQRQLQASWTPQASNFWAGLRSNPNKILQNDSALRAAQQILLAENAGLRQSLVVRLRHVKGKSASVALACRAIFDLHAFVRQDAVTSLKGRPKEEYIEVLLDGLRYPWAPAAAHAAEALAKLDVKEAVPRLVDLLDEPAPDVPFVKKVDGHPVTVVRELVRINHSRNCLLCHAAGGKSRRAPAVAVVPIQGQPLPPSTSVAYYGAARGEVVVRFDVTYLRQDFSTMQPVSGAKPWPEIQRYDYLVRILPLAATEPLSAKHELAGKSWSPYREAVLYALCSLTGTDCGRSSEAWRAWLLAGQR